MKTKLMKSSLIESPNVAVDHDQNLDRSSAMTAVPALISLDVNTAAATDPDGDG